MQAVQIRAALAGIATVMDTIQFHFVGSNTFWGDTNDGDGKYLLLQLKIFNRIQQERDVRLRNGTSTTDDHDWDKWHGRF
jgi:hypothetical protein